MTEIGIDLEAEIARVRDELVSFREVCLPAFFGRGGIPDIDYPGPAAVGLTSRDWAQLADRLLEALPVRGLVGRLDLDDYSFLHVTTEPAYSVDQDRITWRCETSLPIYSGDPLEYIRSQMGAEAAWDNDREALIAQLPDWFLGLAVDDSLLWNALCSTLPVLVDPDPEFVRRALDRETWRVLVANQPGLTPEARAKKLAFLDGLGWRHILNNALLHVMGTAANNRFGLVLDLLDHPNLPGMYTHLMPHYILTVLVAKVRTLRVLAGVEEERHEGGSRPGLGDDQGGAEIGEPAS